MRLSLLGCRNGRIPLARSHLAQGGQVGEGVSPALDAWTGEHHDAQRSTFAVPNCRKLMSCPG